MKMVMKYEYMYSYCNHPTKIYTMVTFSFDLNKNMILLYYELHYFSIF